MQRAVAELDSAAIADAGAASPGPTNMAPVSIPTQFAGGVVFPVLLALSFSHLLNDMMQSLIPALYPMLKDKFALDFGQVGLITLAFQLTASLLQPLIGLYTDRKPMPYSLAIGMGFTLVGLLLLSVAGSFAALVFAASLVGVGSSVFHPESSRVARMASGGRYGLAQSVFQVGGNAGQAIGPLLAGAVVITRGQPTIAWFSFAALLGMVVLLVVGSWYKPRIAHVGTGKRARATVGGRALPVHTVGYAIAILAALTFSKNVYTASLSNYFTFFLMQKFALTLWQAQVHLFIFLAAVAAGTLLGGPFGDRIGRIRVMWVSVLGVLPFTLLLPYANLFWTDVLTIIIGLLMASAFPAILVYAQELLPGRVGMVAGIFFGLAFGLGGLGAAILGRIADVTSIAYVYQLCSYLPLLGLLTALLPRLGEARK